MLRSAWRTRVAVATAALALVLVGGVTAGVRATTGQDPTNYRTAEATRGSVGQTVETSGTIDATQRNDVATGVSGEVEAVMVDTGAKVQAGDVLARLQRTDAARSLRKAEAAVRRARLDLQDAADGQTETVAAATSGGAASSGTGTPSSSAASPTTSSTGTQSTGESTHAQTETSGVEPDEQPTSEPTQQPTAGGDGETPTAEPVPAPELPSLVELSALQTAVASAQTGASDALAAAAAALDAQTAACATAYGRGQQASTPTQDPAALVQDPAATSQDAAVNDACDASLAAVQAAQQAVSDRQNELDSALDGLISVLVAAVQQTDEAAAVLQEWADKQADSSSAAEMGAEQPAYEQPADEQPADEQSAQQQQEQGQSGLPSGAQVATPTVAETPTASEVGSASALSLAAAQAALDSARAERIKARQDLEATRIVAVRSGTVTAVDVAVGDKLSAGDRVAVLVGKKGATVSVELSATEVADIAVGQAAEVTLPGSQKAVAGTVTWVGRVSSSTSTTFPGASTATYSVDVMVPFAELGKTPLPQGARANVSIVVGTSEDAVLVPTSALVAGSQPSVRVVTESGVESRTIEIERSGASRTAIASGVDEGDTVVIADLDAEIDAAGEISTDEGSRPGFPGDGGGNFPGGGPGGAGFPAGGGEPR
jgi:multidrug resistance efflux pump